MYFNSPFLFKKLGEEFAVSCTSELWWGTADGLWLQSSFSFKVPCCSSGTEITGEWDHVLHRETKTHGGHSMRGTEPGEEQSGGSYKEEANRHERRMTSCLDSAGGSGRARVEQSRLSRREEPAWAEVRLCQGQAQSVTLSLTAAPKAVGSKSLSRRPVQWTGFWKRKVSCPAAPSENWSLMHLTQHNQKFISCQEVRADPTRSLSIVNSATPHSNVFRPQQRALWLCYVASMLGRVARIL